MNYLYPVFLYGTLKRGFPNHDPERLGHLYDCKATTITPYPLLVANQWYSPVVLNEPGEGYPVRGELYHVDQNIMNWMDDLEGITLSNGYRKHLTQVLKDNGDLVDAWIYTKTRELIHEIHAGPLRDYQDRRYIGRNQR